MNQKGKGNDCFKTPDFIFKQLDSIFDFTIDAACNTDDCKCDNGFYFDNGDDGLVNSWIYNRVFCNPPFSDKTNWILKADYEVQNNNCPIVVMILPSLCMDTEIWHSRIENKYHYEILKGRISFINPITNKPQKGNNSGTVIVYFKKKIITKEN
jgi:phage N-6-adenine-methyltransferase